MYGDILSKTTEWKSSETGSVITGRMIIKRQNRHGFSIVYDKMDDIYNKIISRKDTRVPNYIIRNMDMNNQLNITTRDLAEKSGVSQANVIEMLKILRDNDLIKTSTAHIMVNPKWRNKKTENGQQKLCLQYATFYKKDEIKINKIMSELRKQYYETKNYILETNK